MANDKLGSELSGELIEKPSRESTLSAPTTKDEKNLKRQKEYNLRHTSIINRIESERRRLQPKEPKTKQRPPPLSKYRRRTANTRERTRMSEINEAFDILRQAVPTEHETDQTRAGRGTKIITLRLAINYIKQLRSILGYSSDSEQNVVNKNVEINTSQNEGNGLSPDVHEQPVCLSAQQKNMSSVDEAPRESTNEFLRGTVTNNASSKLKRKVKGDESSKTKTSKRAKVSTPRRGSRKHKTTQQRKDQQLLEYSFGSEADVNTIITHHSPSTSKDNQCGFIEVNKPPPPYPSGDILKRERSPPPYSSLNIPLAASSSNALALPGMAADIICTSPNHNLTGLGQDPYCSSPGSSGDDYRGVPYADDLLLSGPFMFESALEFVLGEPELNKDSERKS